MRLPLIAFALAKRTHAPNAIGLFENGLVRDTPANELLLTMGDGPNIAGAEWATRTGALMGLLAQGFANLGFVGGAEVDRFGNLNTSYIGDRAHPRSSCRAAAAARISPRWRGGWRSSWRTSRSASPNMSATSPAPATAMAATGARGWGCRVAGQPRSSRRWRCSASRADTHEMELRSWHPGAQRGGRARQHRLGSARRRRRPRDAAADRRRAAHHPRVRPPAASGRTSATPPLLARRGGWG